MRTKEWLKEKRIEYSLTQSQLANKIGVSHYTIEQIEQGKRLGAPETWEKIENFFKDPTKQNIKVSYESEELIAEIKNDIKESSKDFPYILLYNIIDTQIIFVNYDFITKEDPFIPEKELLEDEKYIKTTLEYALEVFEAQNKIL